MKLHIANAFVAIVFTAASLLAVAAQPDRNFLNGVFAQVANSDLSTNTLDSVTIQARESYDLKGSYVDTELMVGENFESPTSAGARNLHCIVSKSALNVTPGSANVSALVDLDDSSLCSTFGYIYYYATDTSVEWPYSGVLAIDAVWHSAAYKYSGVNSTRFVGGGTSSTQSCTFDGGYEAKGTLRIGALTRALDVGNLYWQNSFQTSVCSYYF
jgi:hypothetical protein